MWLAAQHPRSLNSTHCCANSLPANSGTGVKTRTWAQWQTCWWIDASDASRVLVDCTPQTYWRQKGFCVPDYWTRGGAYLLSTECLSMHLPGLIQQVTLRHWKPFSVKYLMTSFVILALFVLGWSIRSGIDFCDCCAWEAIMIANAFCCEPPASWAKRSKI